MPCRAAPPPPPPPHSTQELTPSPPSLSNPLVYSVINHDSSSSNTVAVDSIIPSQDSHDNSIPSQQDVSSSSSTSALSAALSEWQPPASNIPLAQLQSALAHRFLRWAVSEELIQAPEGQYEDKDEEHGVQKEPYEHYDQQQQQFVIDIDQTHQHSTEQAQMFLSSSWSTVAASGQDWAAAHDMVWAEGDYYMAQKTFIREGVAHLKRGRRYIFVEPVLGPESSYLYPRSIDPSSSDDQGVDGDGYENGSEEGVAQQTYDQHSASSNGGSDATVASVAVVEHEQDKDQDEEVIAYEQSTASADWEGDNDNGGDKGEVALDDDETEGRAQTGGLGDKGALPCDGERVEKEESNDNKGDNASNTTTAPTATNNGNNNDNNTAASTVSDNSTSAGTDTIGSNSNNSTNGSGLEDDHRQHSSEFQEPYSPLLDASTDGQDQFEYGLYELQYIPRIQYLQPHQFLPTRQSFIVHLDEDRPTLASPVPIHSKRSECRCQLMMRKVLMHRDLLQVWPQIPPVRTLQEKQQEAEEEARMMEIKQRVQMQTKNWRETLQTQAIACG
ncbi:hypothetical protein BGZ58_003204 [Dissophora ornata]|nr:hypothetical protein BGZ58_003204 [Dissophora ornata]